VVVILSRQYSDLINFFMKLFMKRTATIEFHFCVGILSLISSSYVFSQSTFSQKFGTIDDYNRLYFLNIQYTQSWVKSDTATYNRLLWAEDFVHQNSTDGKLYSKKALLPLFGKPRVEKIDYFFPEDIVIQFITNDVALVSARTPLKLYDQTTQSASRYTDIYVKRSGKWICVSANVSPMALSIEAGANFSKMPEPTTFISMYPGSLEDVATLKELNAMLAEGFIYSKPALLKKVLTDDFLLLTPNGLLHRRPAVLESMTSSRKGAGGIASYTINNLAIRFVTSDVAMLHGVAVTRYDDGQVTGIQYNDIFVSRGGSWVCVSANNTLIK
jgi:hypothetical protein